MSRCYNIRQSGGGGVSHIRLPDKTGNSIGDSPQWADKAGGYGIQTDFGAKYIKGIKGDYYNVVGLPVSRVYHELKKLGAI